MHRFAVGQEHDPEVALLLLDEGPAADPTIGLDMLSDGMAEGRLDPRVENARTVGASPDIAKVLGGLQLKRVSCRLYNARNSAAARLQECGWRMPMSQPPPHRAPSAAIGSLCHARRKQALSAEYGEYVDGFLGCEEPVDNAIVAP